MAHVLAVDVGGTFIKSAVVDTTNITERSITKVTRTPTRVGSDNGQALVHQIVDLCRGSEIEISAVGVCTPGVIDEDRGVIKYATNLKIHNLALRDELQDLLKIPANLGHDGRTAALAEHLVGAGQTFNNVAFLPIGTGISVGLIVDGQVRRSDGLIGEIGHANVGHNEECGCGLRGCFEAIASTSAIARRYKDRSGKTASSEEVFALANSGDADATAIWTDAVNAIAYSCDWLMNTLAPEAIILGGGLSQAGARLLQQIDRKLDERISFHRKPQLLIAALGDNAGCLGAALLAEGCLR
ncbi:MAG: hypothetical protein RL410_977 [Actinomycetota bacterium]|jgi:glucokinase